VDERTQARIYSAGRVVFGGALVVAPGFVGRRWIGSDADSAGARVALVTMGARDVALGLGAERALRAGDPAKAWVIGGAAADLADLVATLVAGRDLPLAGRVLVGAIAAGAAVNGARLAATLD